MLKKTALLVRVGFPYVVDGGNDDVYVGDNVYIDGDVYVGYGGDDDGLPANFHHDKMLYIIRGHCLEYQ